MNEKLTNKDVDKRLRGGNVKRMGNYKGANIKIKFKCLIKYCNTTWPAKPSHILNGHGCPKCSHITLTNKDIDIRLERRNIKRLGDYINSRTSIEFKCLAKDCNHTWPATPNGILNGHGCPKCAGNARITNKDIDQKLNGRNIKRVDECVNGRTKIKFKCLIKDCNHTWPATPDSILNQNSGCPECAGNIKLTNKDIDQKLLGRNIKRLGNCINARTSIKWKCLIKTCYHIWPATPDSILNQNSGCPECNRQGINAKLITKILKQNNINFEKELNIKRLNSTEIHNYAVDFYFTNTNLVIEYNGRQHYEPVCFGGIPEERAKEKFIKQQNRDQYIRNFCQDQNLTLIEIDGRKYKNKKLEKYINELIKNNFKVNK